MKQWLTLLLISLSSLLNLSAQTDWLHILHRDADNILRPLSSPLDRVDGARFIDSSGKGGVDLIRVTLADGSIADIPIGSIAESSIATNIPDIFIDIDGAREVLDKENYLEAQIRIDSYSEHADLAVTPLKIRGRGNTTWLYDKKPYRLKFSKKLSILGSKKSKNFVLLANYNDHTLMRNAIASEIATILGLPFTNSMIPVNLHINGQYRGSYILTEKIGIGAHSVNIDENRGILFELDTHFDENFKFKSDIYKLPVMVADPDFTEIYPDPELADEAFARWIADFNNMENALANQADIESHLDIDTMIDYIITFLVCNNYEICGPKSVYIYKEDPQSTYKFGPVWDFDWAFTFNGREGAGYFDDRLFIDNEGPVLFFNDIVKSPWFLERFNARWNEVYPDLTTRLLEFFDDYAARIRLSAYQNGALWPQSRLKAGRVSTETFDENLADLRQWLINRLSFLNSHPRHGLF